MPTWAAPSGVTPLYIAAQGGHAGVVAQLLRARGIKVDSALVEANASPLMAAVQFGHEMVVKLLLAAPAIDINLRKTDGATALFLAARDNRLGIVEELVECGADVNLALHTGETPLGAAARHGNLEVVRYLLQAPGIRVDQANESGIGPVDIAAHRGHQEIARLLLGKGANPNRANKHGFTQLHRSCLHGNEAIVRILVDAGADTAAEVKGPDGKSYTAYGSRRTRRSPWSHVRIGGAPAAQGGRAAPAGAVADNGGAGQDRATPLLPAAAEPAPRARRGAGCVAASAVTRGRRCGQTRGARRPGGAGQ